MRLAPKFKQWVDEIETIQGLDIIQDEKTYVIWFDFKYTAVLKVASSYIKQTNSGGYETHIGSFEIVSLHKEDVKIPLDIPSLSYLEDKIQPILNNKSIHEWNKEFKRNIIIKRVDDYF